MSACFPLQINSILKQLPPIEKLVFKLFFHMWKWWFLLGMSNHSIFIGHINLPNLWQLSVATLQLRLLLVEWTLYIWSVFDVFSIFVLWTIGCRLIYEWKCSQISKMGAVSLLVGVPVHVKDVWSFLIHIRGLTMAFCLMLLERTPICGRASYYFITILTLRFLFNE